jgi:hypothetical protein
MSVDLSDKTPEQKINEILKNVKKDHEKLLEDVKIYERTHNKNLLKSIDEESAEIYALLVRIADILKSQGNEASIQHVIEMLKNIKSIRQRVGFNT